MEAKEKSYTKAPRCLHVLGQPLVDEIWQDRCDLLVALKEAAVMLSEIANLMNFENKGIFIGGGLDKVMKTIEKVEDKNEQ